MSSLPDSRSSDIQFSCSTLPIDLSSVQVNSNAFQISQVLDFSSQRMCFYHVQSYDMKSSNKKKFGFVFEYSECRGLIPGTCLICAQLFLIGLYFPRFQICTSHREMPQEWLSTPRHFSENRTSWQKCEPTKEVGSLRTF